jgi:hypothetical protein
MLQRASPSHPQGSLRDFLLVWQGQAGPQVHDTQVHTPVVWQVQFLLLQPEPPSLPSFSGVQSPQNFAKLVARGCLIIFLAELLRENALRLIKLVHFVVELKALEPAAGSVIEEPLYLLLPITVDE